MKELITPLVNLNGAAPEDLMNQRLNVCHLLDKAIEEMFKGMPHGRDYQTHQTAFATEDARKAWQERIEALRTIRGELMADAKAIHDQVDWDARRWRKAATVETGE
jgi:hypothetical protein